MRVLVALIVVGAAAALSGATQIPSFNLQMQDVMTPAELRNSGIARLSSSERAALDTWLNEYTARAFRAGRDSVPSSAPARTPVPSARSNAAVYPATGRGHWIDSVSSNGRLVTLEDGSLWEVAAVDQITTMLWLPITDVTVRSIVGVAGFNYELVNTEDGEKAAAKLLSR